MGQRSANECPRNGIGVPWDHGNGRGVPRECQENGTGVNRDKWSNMWSWGEKGTTLFTRLRAIDPFCSSILIRCHISKAALAENSIKWGRVAAQRRCLAVHFIQLAATWEICINMALVTLLWLHLNTEWFCLSCWLPFLSSSFYEPWGGRRRAEYDLGKNWTSLVKKDEFDRWWVPQVPQVPCLEGFSLGQCQISPGPVF